MTEPMFEKILFFDPHRSQDDLLQDFREAGNAACYCAAVALALPKESQEILYARMREIPELRARNFSIPLNGVEIVQAFFSIPGIKDKSPKILTAAAEEISTHPKYEGIFRQGKQILRELGVANQEITVRPIGFLVARIEKRQIMAALPQAVMHWFTIKRLPPDRWRLQPDYPPAPVRGREFEFV